jgi:broad specificity phosphatase PhoE
MQLYLIRHGQAGSRDNYDQLSEIGRKQSVLLGEYFRFAGIRFQAAYSGGMHRQHATAELVLAGLESPPPLQVDPRWNEFSLEGLWTFLAPRLLNESDQFARDYEQHRQSVNVDRVMTACDIELIRTWVRNHYPSDDVEPWEDFQRRVQSPLSDLTGYGSGAVVAVFTSATPTAIWCARALGLDAAKTFQIAAVLFNSNFSTLRLRDEELTLFSLNNTPHLRELELRTFR